MTIDIVALLEGIEIHQSDAERPVQETGEVLAQRFPVGNVRQFIGAAVAIELILLLLGDYFFCFPVQKILQPGFIDEAADQMKRRNIHDILPGHHMLRGGKDHDDTGAGYAPAPYSAHGGWHGALPQGIKRSCRR